MAAMLSLSSCLPTSHCLSIAISTSLPFCWPERGQSAQHLPTRKELTYGLRRRRWRQHHARGLSNQGQLWSCSLVIMHHPRPLPAGSPGSSPSCAIWAQLGSRIRTRMARLKLVPAALATWSPGVTHPWGEAWLASGEGNQSPESSHWSLSWGLPQAPHTLYGTDVPQNFNDLSLTILLSIPFSGSPCSLCFLCSTNT